MTVERTHVLAPPGVDSHGAYVALSRHRQRVDLYYGRDDFATKNKLEQALSRERIKDMATDYSRADPAKAFAERRGITFGKRVAEIVREVPQKARGIFDNFRPEPRPLEIAPPAPTRTTDARYAVERYARALDDINRMHQRQLPSLPHQREALDKAGTALDAVRPHAQADLASAFARHPELVGPAAQGNSQPAIRAMQLEAEIRSDPARRADRFVESWQKLQQQRDRSLSRGEHRAVSRLSSEMGAMAKSLERDAQVESILRGRNAALGIDARSVRSVGQDLAEIAGLGRGRSRGIGISM